MNISFIGQGAELRLHFCEMLRRQFPRQFQYSSGMIPLVDVILRYAKEDETEAWRKIEEGM